MEGSRRPVGIWIHLLRRDHRMHQWHDPICPCHIRLWCDLWLFTTGQDLDLAYPWSSCREASDCYRSHQRARKRVFDLWKLPVARSRFASFPDRLWVSNGAALCGVLFANSTRAAQRPLGWVVCALAHCSSLSCFISTRLQRLIRMRSWPVNCAMRDKSSRSGRWPEASKLTFQCRVEPTHSTRMDIVRYLITASNF